ncbi:putative endonuclease-reverse transcriptase [Operophtera brumata]|nr:putative endonuclease-reverse transcriptase [Operophtera brumata]
MGKKTENKIRPIVTTFTTYGKKIAILKNKHHLKEKTIYVKEDFPQEILETRKKLQVQLQKERNEGKVAFLRYDKLIVKEPSNQENIEKDQGKHIYKNSKKRELETTPPNQIGSQYTSKDLPSPKYQAAAKKTKIRKNHTQRGQLHMTKYLQNHSDTPAYNTALSSDEHGE